VKRNKRSFSRGLVTVDAVDKMYACESSDIIKLFYINTPCLFECLHIHGAVTTNIIRRIVLIVQPDIQYDFKTT